MVFMNKINNKTSNGMKKAMRVITALAALGLFSFLFMYIGSHNMGILNPKGTIAIAQKDLIITALCLMLMVIIPVFILLATFSWRYRASNTKAKYTPDWHSNRALEITWWGISTIIIIILATITWKSTHSLDPFRPIDSSVKPITIQAIALDWKWLFIYPEQNIATVNFIEFPKDVPLNFEITADAPMNAFWIPQLGGQVYAMAGMTAKLHLMANEEGEYSGLSSNFSGAGFSGMKFVAKATSREDFDQWVNTVRLSPLSLSSDEYNELLKQSKNNPVAYYASVKENLYNTIIMKFMAPMIESTTSPSSHMMRDMQMPAMEGMEVN